MRAATLAVLMLCAIGLAVQAQAQEGKTITVTAEGLADPNADTYKRDKGLMIEDLRADAKRQVIEKAVGSYMETSTLMQNYTLVHDKVLSRSQGIIKRIVKESQPWVGEDGFAHLLVTAEVYVGEVKDVLSQMGKQERVSLIKDYGNPRIAVAINIRDAERGVDIKPERSEVAENILKERVKGFGYRVWSASQPGQSGSAPAADFTISGEAKFKTVSAKLQASGLTVTKYVLTSWSVKCVDNHTGEEIYFNNKVPQKQSWPDEDQAIKEIGQLIGSEFSKEFFEEHLQAPAAMYQLTVQGLPSFEAGQMLRKEFIGLRSVLNVDLRNFDRAGGSLFEIEFAGGRANFNQFLQSAILAPLNQKLGRDALTLESAHGAVVTVSYKSQADIVNSLQKAPPAGLIQAAPERLKDVVKSEETLKKVAELSPETAKKLTEEGGAKPASGVDAMKNF
jgi:serine/threonine-protein kinase